MTKSNPQTLPVVFITGTSSGIGLQLFKLLYEKNEYRIVASALPGSIKVLLQLGYREGPYLMLRSLNVLDKKGIEITLREIREQWGGVDFLINNAGISFRSTIEDMTWEDENTQMGVNYNGPMHLIRQVLPTMRKKRSGRIINVSSVGGMLAMPTMGPYSASKFALEAASEALWHEMKPWGISVSLIEPGFINSLAFKKVFYSSKLSHEDSPYHLYYKYMSEFIGKLMTGRPLTSKSVAKKIIRVMGEKKTKLRYPATWDAYFFKFLRL